MTDTEQAMVVGHILAERARRLYESDGWIAPAVTAVGARSLVATPNFGDARDTVPPLATVLAWAARATHIGLIAEAWHRTYDTDDPAALDVRHGDLAARAETDPAVETAVMVTVYPVRNRHAGGTIMSIPRLDDAGQTDWSISAFPGAPEGALADAIFDALDDPPPLPPPRFDDLAGFCQGMCDEGLAVGAWTEVDA